jgi:predicted nucleotidyltransferase
MLEIINKRLGVFFEDCYSEYGVREYSRLVKISPPSASKILKEFEKEGLLLSRVDRRNLLFRVNKDSKIMKDISRVYWEMKLDSLTEHLEKYFPSAIVLFGSLSKLEAKKDSDIDLLFLGAKKEINIEKFEKKLNRKIQIFFYESLDKINKELKINIINGYILRGYLS